MPPDRIWRDDVTLLQIRDAVSLILQRTSELERDEFLDDAEKQDAVILRIAVIGEATKRLSDAFRNAHPEIPWSNIARMRDKLVHGYDQWDLDEVWNVVIKDLPRLLRDLDPLLPRSEQP